MYIAKVTFPSEFGSFTAGRPMVFSRIPNQPQITKKVIRSWLDSGLCLYVADEESDDLLGTDGDYEVGPPVEQESAVSAVPRLAPTPVPPIEPTSFTAPQIPNIPGSKKTPARSTDLGSLSGE